MSTFTTPAPEVKRDRWGRPLIVPPGGGKAVAYTRCTTFVDCVEDKYNLQKWMQRQVAVGLVQRDDLRMAVAAHTDDKRELDRVCEAAMDAAKSSSKATIGTALHSFTEQIDRGSEPTGVPAEYVADLAAYTAATRDLKHLHIEQMTVQDKLLVAGTPDRVVRFGGKNYIADLKTGSIEFGALKVAMQLSMYSRSRLYDVETGERSMHDADLERGIVIHLPAGSGQATLHWIDLVEGWNAVRVASDVRAKRQIKFNDLTEPFNAPETRQPSLADQIAALNDAEAVRALWAANESSWTDDLTQIAAAHIASLSNPAA